MTKRSPAAVVVLAAAALLVLASCGHKPLYNFTRRGTVALSGAVAVQGRFSVTELSGSNATDPHGCAASIHSTPYVIGSDPKISIDGKAFSLELSMQGVRDRVGTHAGYAVVGVGSDSYADPSSTITFGADGGGSVTLHDALQLGTTPGGPVVTGTVRWSCRDGTVGSS